MRPQPKFGFTLIEVLIAMSIVAILAAVALPSYQKVVRKSRRADAMATLTALQLRQEKWRANNSAYTQTLSNLGTPGAAQTAHYEFSVAAASRSTFVLRATAKSGNPQRADEQAGTSCATLELNQSSDRTPADCWR